MYMLEETNCDGIFAVSDYLTTGVMQAATGKRIAIPDTLRIIGYDVDTVLRLIHPTFTTVIQPIEQMADLAVEQLLCRIEGDEPNFPPVVLPATLLKGETT